MQDIEYHLCLAELYFERYIGLCTHMPIHRRAGGCVHFTLLCNLAEAGGTQRQLLVSAQHTLRKLWVQHPADPHTNGFMDKQTNIHHLKRSKQMPDSEKGWMT